MDCRGVRKSLSEYSDDRLGEEETRRIAGHLDVCPACRVEFGRLEALRRSLGSLGEVPVPDYLGHLVDLRLASAPRETWSGRLQDLLSYRWSRIRTTEASWYLTRAMGTAVTFVLFFFIISAAMRPLYFQLDATTSQRAGVSQDFPFQVGINVLKHLGYARMDPAKRPFSRSDPMISDLLLLNFGQNASRGTQEYSFSVVTLVDRSGAATIRNVLEYPSDVALLGEFNRMLSSTRCRPASQNGRAVDSHLVLAFNTISVYD